MKRWCVKRLHFHVNVINKFGLQLSPLSLFFYQWAILTEVHAVTCTYVHQQSEIFEITSQAILTLTNVENLVTWCLILARLWPLKRGEVDLCLCTVRSRIPGLFSNRQSTLSNSYNQVSKASVVVILTYMYMELRYWFGFASMICKICVWYAVYKVRVKQVSPSSDQLM